MQPDWTYYIYFASAAALFALFMRARGQQSGCCRLRYCRGRRIVDRHCRREQL